MNLSAPLTSVVCVFLGPKRNKELILEPGTLSATPGVTGPSNTPPPACLQPPESSLLPVCINQAAG